MMQLQIHDRLRITEETKGLMPEGYNWVGSCPIVDGFSKDGQDVVVHQVGYPQQFVISRAAADTLRAAFVNWAKAQPVIIMPPTGIAPSGEGGAE